MFKARSCSREVRRVGWCLALGALINFPLAWYLSWRPRGNYAQSDEIPCSEAPVAKQVARAFGPPIFACRGEMAGLGLTYFEIEHSKASREEVSAARAAAPSDTTSGPAAGTACVWYIGIPWRSLRITDLSFSGEKAVWKAMLWLSPTSLEKGWRFNYPFRSLIPGLALQPIPIGFALNTILYASLMWCGRFAPSHLRRYYRRRKGLCLNCGYAVGNLSRCPECGEASTANQTPK